MTDKEYIKQLKVNLANVGITWYDHWQLDYHLEFDMLPELLKKSFLIHGMLVTTVCSSYFPTYKVISPRKVRVWVSKWLW